MHFLRHLIRNCAILHRIGGGNGIGWIYKWERFQRYNAIRTSWRKADLSEDCIELFFGTDMEYKDYYKIMGVKRDAGQDEIKRAYRRLARKYHPDVSKEKDAEAHFKEVGEAYEVLKDPQKRAAYDRLGSNWQAGQDFHPPPNWDSGFEFSGGGFTHGNAADFSDFFESLFGGRGPFTTRGHFRARGEDQYIRVLIDLDDAYHGATRTLMLQLPEVDAQGRLVNKQRTLNVHIPKGIRPGQHIRLGGQGAPGVGNAPTGDLYLQVELRAHPFYRIDGKDVYLELPLTPWEAALGATVQVPTPEGKVDLKIPPNSAPGQKMRLKGRGIPGKTPGDFYVLLQIALPPAHTEAAKALYRSMQSQLNFNPRAYLGV
jgi:curved DNA-binding protein